MKESPKSTCPRCQIVEAELAKVKEELARMREEMARMAEKLAAAKKDSSTSSKPPSSDIVKPKAAVAEGDETTRKIGGQPGHPMHAREPFPPEQIDKVTEYKLDVCPDCDGELRCNAQFQRVVQQMDIDLPPKLHVEEHVCPEYWCDHCQKPFRAPLPLPIERGGLVGPHLISLIAYMKGFCHASFSTIRKYLRDVMGVKIGRGTLAKIINKVSESLEGTYEELLEMIPLEAKLNIDETGHKDNGERWWTWCFRADLYTLFHIDSRRNVEVLIETLGVEFNGVIGCDYFGAYRKYMRLLDVEVQFCLAHLIRDVKFLTTLPNAATKAYGERLRLALREMFAVIHRREKLSKAEFERELELARQRVLRVGLNDVPATSHAQNLADRFRKHGEAYFTFVTTPGIDPTNNTAEQAIRFVVIDRRITQGTRGENGRKWSERIWTVMATCSQQGRSAHEFLKTAIINWLNGKKAPSLLDAATA
jgi:transposase